MEYKTETISKEGFDFPGTNTVTEVNETQEANTQETKTTHPSVVEPITRTCSCGQVFYISPAEQKFYHSKGFKLPKKCPGCRKHKNEVHTFTCKDCNKEFTMTANEINFFKNRGYEVPKRCPECRAFRKASNNKN